MHLAEITVAGCRIYGAALPAGEQGFQAGVVVRESAGDLAQTTEWLRASPLAAGQVWSTAEAALSFAMLVVPVLSEALAVIDHQVQGWRLAGPRLVFQISSTAPRPCYPRCRNPNVRQHGHYWRHPSDLPSFGTPVTLDVEVRRWRCMVVCDRYGGYDAVLDPTVSPHVRIVAASIEPKEGAKTRRRRGSIRQGIQGPGGGEVAATGERSGRAGIRRSGPERLAAGAVAGRSAGIGKWRRRACAPGVDGCGATAGGDCDGIAERDGEVGVVPRAGGVCAGADAVEHECAGRTGRPEGGDQRRIQWCGASASQGVGYVFRYPPFFVNQQLSGAVNPRFGCDSCSTIMLRRHFGHQPIYRNPRAGAKPLIGKGFSVCATRGGYLNTYRSWSAN